MFLGYRVKELREKRGYTQEELGIKIGVSKSAVSNYETGSKMPSMGVLIKLIAVFDVPADYFMANQVTVVSEESDYSTKMSNQEVVLIMKMREHHELYNRILADPERSILKMEVNVK